MVVLYIILGVVGVLALVLIASFLWWLFKILLMLAFVISGISAIIAVGGGPGMAIGIPCIIIGVIGLLRMFLGNSDQDAGKREKQDGDGKGASVG